MKTLYTQLGEDNLQQLIDEFYDRVQKDDTINHLFTTGFDMIKKKQFMFLSQFLGGPGLYSAEYGHPRMRLKHIPHKITEQSAVSWLKNMRNAIWSLDIEEPLKIELFNRFPQVAAHMVNS